MFFEIFMMITNGAMCCMSGASFIKSLHDAYIYYTLPQQLQDPIQKETTENMPPKLVHHASGAMHYDLVKQKTAPIEPKQHDLVKQKTVPVESKLHDLVKQKTVLVESKLHDLVKQKTVLVESKLHDLVKQKTASAEPKHFDLVVQDIGLSGEDSSDRAEITE